MIKLCSAEGLSTLMFCWFNVKFPFRIVLDFGSQHSSYVELQNIPFGFHCTSHPTFGLSFFFNIELFIDQSSLHWICIIFVCLSAHEMNTIIVIIIYKYIWTTVHAFFTLMYSVFDRQYLHSMTWSSYFGVCIFCPDHDFYDFFFTHRTFFSTETEGTKWLRNVYISAESCMKVFKVVFRKIWYVSMVTMSSPPIRLPDTNTHVVNTVVLAD